MVFHFALSAVAGLILTHSLLSVTTSLPNTSSTVIDATYSASRAATYPTQPTTPERVASTVSSRGTSWLHLDASDPALVRAFLYSNTTHLLTIPNLPLAANRSNAFRWLYAHVVPFFPRTKISAISVGNDLFEATLDR